MVSHCLRISRRELRAFSRSHVGWRLATKEFRRCKYKVECFLTVYSNNIFHTLLRSTSSKHSQLTSLSSSFSFLIVYSYFSQHPQISLQQALQYHSIWFLLLFNLYTDDLTMSTSRLPDPAYLKW